MRAIMLIALIAVLIISCEQSSQQLSAEQQKAEQKKVWTTIKKFTTSIEDESWEAFKSTITEDCIIYGTDLANVDQGYAELEPHMQRTFDAVENSSIIDFRDKSIKLKCDLSSVMFNATWNTNMGGADVSLPLRWAFTLEKKPDAWLISQCSVAMPTVGQAGDETAH